MGSVAHSLGAQHEFGKGQWYTWWLNHKPWNGCTGLHRPLELEMDVWGVQIVTYLCMAPSTQCSENCAV